MANFKGRGIYNMQAKTKTILKHMKVVGKKQYPMVEEKPSIKMEIPTKETSLTVFVQVLASMSLIVVSDMKDSGKITIFMEMVSYFAMESYFSKVNSRMV